MQMVMKTKIFEFLLEIETFVATLHRNSIIFTKKSHQFLNLEFLWKNRMKTSIESGLAKISLFRQKITITILIFAEKIQIISKNFLKLETL